MKIYILFLSFIFICNASFSQDDGVQTIKIKKEFSLVKAAFDETEYKVIAFDRFGNPHVNAIKSFTIRYIDGKQTFEAPVVGNVFPKQTIDFLTKKKKEATKICLSEIKAENKEGHIETLPELCDIVIFPDCKKTAHKRK